jgi:hypothetical protein
MSGAFMKNFIFLLFFFPLFVFANGYGIATLVKGSVHILTSDGKNKILKRGDKVFETDTIVTASKSIVRVVMIDTNIIDVYPNSKVLIKQYTYSPQEDNKNVRLEVATGQIKSTVKQKYDNEKNKYNVKTPAIVAGVRGTIFTTEHELQTGTSRVFTHEGNVLVGRIDAQENVKDFFSVKANQKIQIDRTIERPQVVEVLKDEIQKQKKSDRDDGFVKPEKDAGGRPDSARPSGAINSSVPVNFDGRIRNPGEVKKDDLSTKREDSESPKREESAPLNREEAPSARQPDRDSGRPDGDESKKDIKKRLQDELKRLKREQAKRTRKEI